MCKDIWYTTVTVMLIIGYQIYEETGDMYVAEFMFQVARTTHSISSFPHNFRDFLLKWFYEWHNWILGNKIHFRGNLQIRTEY